MHTNEATTTGTPMYTTLSHLLRAYLDSLRDRACYKVKVHTASEWLLKLPQTPTYEEVMDRHLAKGHGDFQPGSAQANQELGLLRAACRWGIYLRRWKGGDPTAGIRKWKRAKRQRTGKYAELTKLLAHFEQATTDYEIRDRALFGLMLFTGCRPSEARRATLESITPYGQMGAWVKGMTKTGEPQEVPLPSQLMPWLTAWQAIRKTDRPNPYLFPGQSLAQPISQELVKFVWGEMRTALGITGLWNYDLRRTLATSMSNELGYDDSTIRAILNHNDSSALSHYRHKSFDSLLGPIQRYADWLIGLKQPTVSVVAPSPVCQVGLAVEVKEAPKRDIAEPTPRLSQTVARPPTTPPIEPAPYKLIIEDPALSPREQQVLTLIGQGCAVRNIATSLQISIKTVGTYRGRLLDKLQVRTTADLARYANAHVTEATAPVPTPPPVMAPAVVSPSIPAPMPIIRRSRNIECEDLCLSPTLMNSWTFPSFASFTSTMELPPVNANEYGEG